MFSTKNLTYFAANTYDCGTYGAGNFNENECNTTATAGTPDTGVAPDLGTVYFVVGGLLVAAAIVLLVLARRKKAK